MLGDLIKNDCNDLYFHQKPFKTDLKANSYLASIFYCGPVNLSTPTLPNINLAKTNKNLLVIWKITEKGCNNLHLLLKAFRINSKSNSYLMSISCCGPVNLSTPTCNINITETMTNLLAAWKLNQKLLNNTFCTLN